MRGWLRALGHDLAPFAGTPLAPLRSTPYPWLAWLQHTLVALLAALVAGVGWHTLIEDFGVSDRMAGALSVTHAVSVVLFLYWPMAGWWLSLGASVATSLVAGSGGGEPLWVDPSLYTHLVVLTLVGLRVRPRVLAEMWLLTLLAGAALAVALPGRDDVPDLLEMTLVSAMVLIFAGAVRARSEAMRQLAHMEHIGEAERARRALLEERARIARELHDVVAHHMSVIAIQAEAAPYRVPDPPEELTRNFHVIRTNAVEALTELRRVLGVLRAEGPSEAPEPQPSLDRLDDLVANARAAGLAVRAVVRGGSRVLPPGVELSAYRIVQEALSNAMRHAPGSTLQVELIYRPTALEIHVVNGPPHGKPVASPGPGHGVLGMRERVAMLGGELSADPRPDGGFAVTAVLPLTESEDECPSEC